MSPFSANYSSIDEVWGDNFTLSAKKREKRNNRKLVKDPVCDLYDLGSSPSKAYTDVELMEYINGTGGADPSYSKIEFMNKLSPPRRTVNDLAPPSDIQIPIESPPTQYQPPQEYQQELYEPSITVQQPEPSYDKNVSNTNIKNIRQKDDDVLEFLSYIDKTNTVERDMRNNTIIPLADIGLYLISGIILIFMMEQFVKLGLSMRGY